MTDPEADRPVAPPTQVTAPDSEAGLAAERGPDAPPAEALRRGTPVVLADWTRPDAPPRPLPAAFNEVLSRLTRAAETRRMRQAGEGGASVAGQP